ncbi:MAG TPA: isoprenylcysteine carboxylmethyltransferase family protein [Gemmatimonadaceae bacterium]|nr:isoprenylcysteine carboxylmethyltransferase family protein [Gemmatimonadaceae bacterium]
MMIWLRTLLFAVTVVATVLVLIPLWIVQAGGPAQIASGAGRYVGPLLISAGTILMLWCWGAFAVRGRGTPMPIDPPRRLVIVGPYRYVRNPMYIAGITVILGLAAVFGAKPLIAYAAGYWLAAHLFVVLYEERTLSKRFGAEYAAYRAAVGRWIPRTFVAYEGSSA